MAVSRVIRNWKRMDISNRTLIAGGLGLVATLSFNSFVNATWTLPPFVAIGWLVLGLMASPRLVAVCAPELLQKEGGYSEPPL